MTPEALELVAERFRVMGDALRLRILQSLEEGERSVSELVELVETTQPNVSRHLKRLQDAGLVTKRQEKNSVFYSIADETVFELCDVVCNRMRERLMSQVGALPPARPARPVQKQARSGRRTGTKR